MQGDDHSINETSDERDATTGEEQPLSALSGVLPEKVRRRSVRVFEWLVRIAVYGATAVAVLMALVYTGVRLFVKADDVKAMVKKAVEEQTGGRFDIGKVEFNVLTGLRFESVQFYAPAAGDTRGFLGGGEVNLAPLANFEVLDIRYSIPRAMFGRLHLNALQLVEPQIHLKQTDGVWNFDPILAYRAAHFPPAPEEEKPKEEEKPSDPGAALLPFSPALIYMPIEIMAQNIGIKDLRLDMITEEKGKIASIILTSGLSFEVGTYWFGRESSMWLSLLSTFEKPLEIDIKEVPRDANGAIAGDLQQVLSARTALNLRSELADLKRINVDFATRVLSLETAFAGYQDIGTFVKLRLVAADDYKGINFDTFDVNLAEALIYELRGNVNLPSGGLDAINLKLKQKVAIDLKQAAQLAKPFVPDLVAGGMINVEELKIEGTIEPEKLNAADGAIPLPYVSSVVWLEDVALAYPPVGVVVEPLSGDVTLAAGPSLSGTGSQIDLGVNVDIPKVSAKQNVSGRNVAVGIEAMVAKVTARLLWPEMIAPILKVNAEAEHITASGDGLPAIDVPLFMDIDAEGRKDLQRLGLSASVELTDLVEFSAMADCQQGCSKFRSSVLARLDSLRNLHAIALPLGSLVGAGDFMPTDMAGTIDMQFAARGKLLDPLSTPVPELLKAADVRFNSVFNVAKLSANVPFMNVALKDFETRFLAAGTLAQQRIDLSQKFESLSVELPKSEGQDKGLAVSLGRFSFDTAVVNDIDGPIDLPRVMQQLSTTVKTRVFLGKAAVGDLLPRPLSELSVSVDASQKKMAQIRLHEFNAKVPDFGADVTASASTDVTPEFKPKWIKAKVSAKIAHSGGERLPLGVKTTGAFELRGGVASDDMDAFAVDGLVLFDKFNVTIPGKTDKDPVVLAVEDMRGQIPLQQTVKLSEMAKLQGEIDKLFKRPGAAAVAATDATVEAAPAVDATPEIPVSDDGDIVAPSDPTKLKETMAKYFEKTEDTLAENTNVVALVDYGTVRPFYPDRKPLSIKRLEVANLELSNMEFDIELKQHWFAVNQFVIGFLGGKLQGDFQLAFEPMPRALRTSLHMTRLDTRKLIERFPNLQGKAGGSLFSNPYIDGTVLIRYDLKTSELDGGVEITSIGKDQLKMMLYYVDPFEQNPTIGSIRTALSFGEVRQVSVPIKNGEIGMDVDVRVVSVPFPTPKLTRFPITQLINNLKDQMLKGQEPAPAEPAAPATPAAGPTTDVPTTGA
jgi:hypothetical protein